MDKSLNGNERVFVDCLREIERSYLNLPKQLRIRVEKWVEKLVITGNNEVWRKHRNAYAKLLLSMVISRNLSDPFHILPPDGPLPSYPFHLKSFSKNTIGPHESVFWHDLYSRCKDPMDNISTEINPKVLTTLPQSREIDNLNLLIKEQARRIQLLEEQLHSERVQHELQIQRLHYTHRVDLSAAVRSSTNSSYHDNNQFSIGGDLNLSRASPLKTTTSLPNFLHPSSTIPLRPPLTATLQRGGLETNTNRDIFDSYAATSSRSDREYNFQQHGSVPDILPSPGIFQPTFRPDVDTSRHFNSSDDDFMDHINQFQDEIGKINRALGSAMMAPGLDVYMQESEEQMQTRQFPQHTVSAHRLSRSEFSD
jgi:hypothetical protein